MTTRHVRARKKEPDANEKEQERAGRVTVSVP